MAERHASQNAVGNVARLGGATIVLIVMALAFVGMGLFMWNMGSDMSRMTESVVQMGKDVGRMMPFVP